MFVDLGGELPCRREDEGPRRAARPVDQPVEDRKKERGRLAAPRRGAGRDIAAHHRGADRVLLDRGRLGESEALDPGLEVRVEAEGSEAIR
jgi:hypothetical protein